MINTLELYRNLYQEALILDPDQKPTEETDKKIINQDLKDNQSKQQMT